MHLPRAALRVLSQNLYNASFGVKVDLQKCSTSSSYPKSGVLSSSAPPALMASKNKASKGKEKEIKLDDAAQAQLNESKRLQQLAFDRGVSKGRLFMFKTFSRVLSRS